MFSVDDIHSWLLSTSTSCCPYVPFWSCSDTQPCTSTALDDKCSEFCFASIERKVTMHSPCCRLLVTDGDGWRARVFRSSLHCVMLDCTRKHIFLCCSPADISHSIRYIFFPSKDVPDSACYTFGCTRRRLRQRIVHATRVAHRC